MNRPVITAGMTVRGQRSSAYLKPRRWTGVVQWTEGSYYVVIFTSTGQTITLDAATVEVL